MDVKLCYISLFNLLLQGKDTVFTCAHNSLDDSTGFYASYNEIDPKRNIPIEPREVCDCYYYIFVNLRNVVAYM